ncbi:Diphthamide biosynthesis protein 4 [Xylographa carneopallida]|nr:Diphthamide biosynthesis protein 4 [Xylographa carneopallida]
MLINYYEVLSLPDSPVARRLLKQEDIKHAYKRALLQHHPDKSTSAINLKPGYTIDDITAAYKGLSDSIARSKLDRELQLRTLRGPPTTDVSLSGLETIDLDDLDYDEEGKIWYRSCRCGIQRAYLISEDELIKEAAHGEIITGCGGCSLWLKILFQAADEG